MYSGIRRNRQSVSVWPGYVDALSALLMVVIFIILIFTVAHFLFSNIVTNQESELTRLQRSLQTLNEALGLEKATSQRLSKKVSDLSTSISLVTTEKVRLDRQVQALSASSAEDQTRIQQQLLLIASLQEDIAALRKVRSEMEARVGQLAGRLTDQDALVGTLRDRSKALSAILADEKERTLLSQKTIASQDIRIQALAAIVGDQKEALSKEKALSAEARAAVAAFSRQVAAMQQQLKEIGQALAVAHQEKKSQAEEIEDLGRRLNIELARRVNDLANYRSEFFGRLKAVLGDSDFVRIEGDRFVFQSELLFASGSADLGPQGRNHLKTLSRLLITLPSKIPDEIDWILRVDGHTDRVPAHNTRFGSNWELSTARAVSVVRFLILQGIPENRVTAAGFGEFHPIDTADTPKAYRKNRRIEIKLTAK